MQVCMSVCALSSDINICPSQLFFTIFFLHLFIYCCVGHLGGVSSLFPQKLRSSGLAAQVLSPHIFWDKVSLTAPGVHWLARLAGQQTLEMLRPPPQDLGYTCLFSFYNGLGYLNADLMPTQKVLCYTEVPLVWCLQLYSFSQEHFNYVGILLLCLRFLENIIVALKKLWKPSRNFDSDYSNCFG